jgi:hypothetical protein
MLILITSLRILQSPVEAAPAVVGGAALPGLADNTSNNIILGALALVMLVLVVMFFSE